jgi:hypothetical protein
MLLFLLTRPPDIAISANVFAFSKKPIPSFLARQISTSNNCRQSMSCPPLPIPYSSIGKVRARRAIHFYDFDGAKQDIGVAPRRTNRTSVKTISACNSIL